MQSAEDVADGRSVHRAIKGGSACGAVNLMSTSITLDGFGPLPLVRPTSVDDLGELVRHAAANDAALYPLGGQTHACLGMPPTKQGQAIDLRGLDQIIDFAARDMTVTVEAGITVECLRETL